MAAHNTPRPAPTDTVLNPVEIRLSGGMLALTRFLMTLQNKRMPIASFTVGRDGEDRMRATILLDCPPESARRYTALLSALEDVEEIGAAKETMEVALLKAANDAWRESAARVGNRAARRRRDDRSVRGAARAGGVARRDKRQFRRRGTARAAGPAGGRRRLDGPGIP
jgi:hypothetical protein